MQVVILMFGPYSRLLFMEISVLQCALTSLAVVPVSACVSRAVKKQ